jgi:hypothetical protein
MSNEIQLIEDDLKVKLPEEYKQFIINNGLISNDIEVYGYVKNMDVNKIPCVIGATKLYKKNYDNIKNNEIVIAFDEYNNTPIVLNEDNVVYSISYNKRKLLNNSFSQWLKEYINENS